MTSIFELSERLLSPPSSPIESEHHLNDQRALEKLALELSMLDMTSATPTSAQNSSDGISDLMSMQSEGIVPGSTLNAFTSMLGFNGVHFDDRKKSQNMTECVPVPSSEHVAEIVGRQGCKIKALRAKTNTYIKTPVRGEEPVFVVTGRKEDVAKAKREILSAAEHFSLIRASRKPSLLNGLKGAPPGPPTNIPGQVTILVRVPYRVVGLVVGPKGATIKHIQQSTQTYIVTPSRDKEPVFEVTGLPDNVQSARKQIEAHIAIRTGNTQSNDIAQDLLASPLLSSLYKNGLSSLLEHLDLKEQEMTTQMISSTGSSTCSSSSSGSSTSSKSASMMIRPELIDLWKTMGNDATIDCDEGIGDSSPINIWSLPNSSMLGSRSSPTASASPTDSLLTSKAKTCYYCGEKEINSMLIPCGHQIYCIECSERTCDAREPCLICNQKPTQSMKTMA
ncbi:hypothetical protein PVAND_016622 [Polypedilum vanderplanki]|uniref:RING-type domain-containing protein n=1 Tax=Polypedilum vanderplanki TaxID=319348 RepID=A0A9J6BFY7_POLVA|nr:hypothetical protein PVAND_016622 [Polypedilum vanderplanki]